MWKTVVGWIFHHSYILLSLWLVSQFFLQLQQLSDIIYGVNFPNFSGYHRGRQAEVACCEAATNSPPWSESRKRSHLTPIICCFVPKIKRYMIYIYIKGKNAYHCVFTYVYICNYTSMWHKIFVCVFTYVIHMHLYIYVTYNICMCNYMYICKSMYVYTYVYICKYVLYFCPLVITCVRIFQVKPPVNKLCHWGRLVDLTKDIQRRCIICSPSRLVVFRFASPHKSMALLKSASKWIPTLGLEGNAEACKSMQKPQSFLSIAHPSFS